MREMIKAAWRSLWQRRGRTVLTMGGIVIGVALVAVVTVIGVAGKQTVDGELDSMGLRGLSVTATGTDGLKEDGLSALRGLRAVSSAAPLMVDSTTAVRHDGGVQSLMLCGIDSGETQAIGLIRCHGRMLSRQDIASCARVCVVDTAVAQSLFSRDNIVGVSLMLTVGDVEEPFTVVGVTKAGSNLLQNVTRLIPGMVYVPYSTVQQLTGRTTFDQFAVKLIDGADEAAVAGCIEQVLGRLEAGAEYKADNLSAQKDKLSSVMNIVTAVLTAISAISLLVAGLSIMTIMTVSVGERTREIGIKKALGATGAQISAEFLTEALLMSTLGGVIGVAVGSGLGMFGLRVVGVSVTLPMGLLWLVVFAAAVGVVFGVYPAVKAARLHPVEALREQ